MAKTFDGPPTLERSGSEHRRAVTSFLLRRKAWLEVELPLERETEGFEKIPSLMGKSDASECNENSLSNCREQLALSTKKDGMILEFLIIRTKVKPMNIVKTNIEGVLIIEPRLFRDARGYFFESFSEREFEEKVAPILGHSVHFCQDNESMSSYGVMRGLHFQRPPYTQSKLVRCVKGRVLDVAVDIRKGSPTYGKHVAVELTEDNHRQFFIPKGFAHGFAVLSETAVFQYKCDNFYHPEADGGISILDDTLGIDWKIPTEHANLSEKDTKHAMLKDFDSPFDINVDLYK